MVAMEVSGLLFSEAAEEEMFVSSAMAISSHVVKGAFNRNVLSVFEGVRSNMSLELVVELDSSTWLRSDWPLRRPGADMTGCGTDAAWTSAVEGRDIILNLIVPVAPGFMIFHWIAGFPAAPLA